MHLPTLCRHCGWEFIHGRIVGLDSAQRRVRYLPAGTTTESTIDYTYASLDVGSQTKQAPGSSAPESMRCIFTRPISGLNSKVEAYLAYLRAHPKSPVCLTVVGSGTAGKRYTRRRRLRPFLRIHNQLHRDRMRDSISCFSSCFPCASRAGLTHDTGKAEAGQTDVVSTPSSVVGVELCFSLKARIERDADCAVVATLLDAHDELMPGASRMLRRAIYSEAKARRVEIRLGQRVVRYDERFLYMDGAAEPLEYDLVVFATGAAAAPWLREQTDLKTDANGFVSVRDTLQVETSDALFACGDCASMSSFKGAFPPKAGVYAVRMGPIVLENLKLLLGHHHSRPQQQQQEEQAATDATAKAATPATPATAATDASAAPQGSGSEGDAPKLHKYAPQQDFLSLICLGDQRAIGTKWGVALSGGWAWTLKDSIDRKWMSQFDFGDDEGVPGDDCSNGSGDASNRRATDHEGPASLEEEQARFAAQAISSLPSSVRDVSTASVASLDAAVSEEAGGDLDEDALESEDEEEQEQEGGAVEYGSRVRTPAAADCSIRSEEV